MEGECIMTVVKVPGKSSTDIAKSLAKTFSETAAERDLKGGNPKTERDLIRKSGLLKLLIPEKFGGLGGTWTDVVNIVRIFARADSSIAHVFGYHHVNLITPHLYGNEEQQDYYYRETAENNWFWGNAFNPVDIKLRAHKEADHIVLNGVKTFCSGSVDSDYLIVSALYEGQEKPLVAVIPTKRIGVTVNRDWDNFGQRQTDSGSVSFKNVIVEDREILKRAFNSNEFSRLRVNVSHFILNHVFLGIMEGAFEEARKYTLTKAKSRAPGVQSAIKDPNFLRHYGEFSALLEAASLLVEKTDRLFQQLWDKGEIITADERSELTDAIFKTKIFITKAGLELTTGIFDVMGSRSTSNRYRFDRFWRNLRTMTLHVPVDIVAQEVGARVLSTES